MYSLNMIQGTWVDGHLSHAWFNDGSELYFLSQISVTKGDNNCYRIHNYDVIMMSKNVSFGIKLLFNKDTMKIVLENVFKTGNIIPLMIKLKNLDKCDTFSATTSLILDPRVQFLLPLINLKIYTYCNHKT